MTSADVIAGQASWAAECGDVRQSQVDLTARRMATLVPTVGVSP